MEFDRIGILARPTDLATSRMLLHESQLQALPHSANPMRPSRLQKDSNQKGILRSYIRCEALRLSQPHKETNLMSSYRSVSWW